MSIIIPANSAAGGGLGYQVDNSCSFNFSSTSYMTKQSSSVANQQKFTISVWVKRSNNLTYSSGGFNNDMQIIGQTTSSYCRLMFNSANSLRFYGETRLNLATTRLFRDFSAWYHVFIAVDTTQGTAANRVKMYVNGVQETNFATETYPNQNDNIVFFQNSNNLVIGRSESYGGYDYINGYLSEFICLEGTAAAPTDFGEFDADSGLWKAIETDQSANKGANGFYLDFKDSSNLGNDVYGGTDFTESGLAATDQSLDTCTNNFATLNVLANVIAPVTLSEGTLKIAMTNSKGGNLSTISCTDGKYYAEMKITTAPQDFRFHWGIMPHPVIAADDPINAANAGIMLSGYNAVIYAANGIINNFYGNATGRFSGNPILGLAIDLKSATRTIAISINGAWVTGSNATDTDFSNALKVDITSYVATYPNWFIGCGSGNGSGTTGVYELNFGSPPFAISSSNTDGNDRGNFEYPVPSGYLALCSLNLSEELS